MRREGGWIGVRRRAVERDLLALDVLRCCKPSGERIGCCVSLVASLLSRRRRPEVRRVSIGTTTKSSVRKSLV